MIHHIINEIKMIIEDIYKQTYSIYKDNLNDKFVEEFIVGIRYYEIIIQEIEDKGFYKNENELQETLLKIKKELLKVSLNII